MNTTHTHNASPQKGAGLWLVASVIGVATFTDVWLQYERQQQQHQASMERRKKAQEKWESKGRGRGRGRGATGRGRGGRHPDRSAYNGCCCCHCCVVITHGKGGFCFGDSLFGSLFMLMYNLHRRLDCTLHEA